MNPREIPQLFRFSQTLLLPKTNSHYPESVLDNEKWSETTTALRIKLRGLWEDERRPLGWLKSAPEATDR